MIFITKRQCRVMLFSILCLMITLGNGAAQETRGTIRGRVLDASQAVVTGASVSVENTETNTSTRLTTNEAGYYEATLLMPGNYRISAEFTGFKKTVRTGMTLPMGGSLEINVILEVGGTSETVSVTAEAPLLDTRGISSGIVLDNQSVMDLPVIANNVMVLVKMTPGLYTNGVNDYLGPHSISGASNYSIGGGGGNEWSIDGVPNNGANRQTAYLPHSDTVQEVKVETSNFDAAIGHTSGASVTMMTKSGTNQFHGSLTEQHWQQRWQATNFFTNQAYYRSIADAEAKGDFALANQIRSTPKQASGRSNNYTAAIGGPIRIPQLFDGRDRLFFFFSYQGNKDQVADLPDRMNITVPTMDDREGNFARFLAIDPVRYQIYDPLTVKVDPARAGHYIRSPFAGNILPKNRWSNPTLNFYSKVFPVPNNDYDPKREPLNNYLSNAPLIRNYKAYSNRIDFHQSEKHRFFGRWTWNDWFNYAQDWTYKTVKGLQSAAQSRTNLGATIDWVYTINPTTIMDTAISYNDYRDGNRPEVAKSYKPSDAGFPTYMDDKAADQHILPVLNLGGSYNSVSTTLSNYTHYRNVSGRVDLTHIRNNHTLHAGADLRLQYRTGGGGGNTSGTFTYSNVYTRKNDDTFTPAGNLAHPWASYLLGIPESMTIATSDNYAMINPYYAWYVQDNWRLSRKLSLNLGLRIEYETGPTERFDRMITGFDPNATLPISAAAQAAYAKSPIPELDASKFTVKGGSLYAGFSGADRKVWRNELMWLPRISAAYTINDRTVLQAGYGIFYDTLNVLNQGPDQSGFSRSTSTILTNDFGVTWLAGNPPAGVSPLADPFPKRADGSRFDVPTGNKLGLMARAGRGFSYNDFDAQHPRQQRWRIGIQRQLTKSMVVDISYSGMRVSRIPVSLNLSPLPESNWASGTVRNDAIASNLNANVTNPFRITNFSSMQTSDPLVYADMSTQSFYTSATIRKNLLLRAFPQMNSLTRSNSPLGKAYTDTMEITFQRRFSKGFNMNVGYTWTRSEVADFFYNEFDSQPSYRLSNNVRPHRLVATGIYQLPFGKGRPFAQSGIWNHLFGGFQIAATYEYQPGPLLEWGNLFFYGNTADISKVDSNIDRWFNTDNFERTSSKTPAAFHRRVFPSRIEGVRADNLDQWNANIQRDFKIKEGLILQLRMDALNLLNATQFAGPNVNPTSTDFGRVTSQTNTTKRFLQLQARIRF